MKIAVSQLNFTVADFRNNLEKIKKSCLENHQKCDLMAFSELSLSGYPPEDMVIRQEFLIKSQEYLEQFIEFTKELECDVIIGAPRVEDGDIYNSIFIVSNGEILYSQDKYDLPNYGVFDEKRVFTRAKNKPRNFIYKGINLGILICEDIWNIDNAEDLQKADLIISINASPFEFDKYQKRLSIAQQISLKLHAPFIYINQVCGHDDLVFDGGSFVKDGHNIVAQAKYFDEDCIYFDTEDFAPIEDNVFPCKHNQIYQVCMLSLKDYAHKNGFKGVTIGVSGGVDSALTAAIAVDSFGAENVKLVLLPSKFTSDDSTNDAKELCNNLGANLDEISIKSLFDNYLDNLKDIFPNDNKWDNTEENLQSRIRGTLLMAISNKYNLMLVTTGNKSEVAVGYCTLYGDMCGGYNVLKDIYKTVVFELCDWRNDNIPQNTKLEKKNIIPKNTITKAPTAELRDDQKDEDSLPKYEVLDQILELMVEEDLSPEEVYERGFEKEVVDKVEKLLYQAEFKRRQASPGVKVTSKPFSRDRRYPITNKITLD